VALTVNIADYSKALPSWRWWSVTPSPSASPIHCNRLFVTFYGSNKTWL